MQEIKMMNTQRRKLNYVLWRIGETKRTGTNFMVIPIEKVDAETVRFLRGRGYRLHWMPVRKKLLIEWKYERSPHRPVRTSGTRIAHS